MSGQELFIFKLADRLGFPHPDYLLPFLSARQLTDWERYAATVGIGPERDDIHWGLLTSTLVNVNRAANSSPAQPKDFMPYFDPLAEDITADDLAARLGLRR